MRDPIHLDSLFMLIVLSLLRPPISSLQNLLTHFFQKSFHQLEVTSHQNIIPCDPLYHKLHTTHPSHTSLRSHRPVFTNKSRTRIPTNPTPILSPKNTPNPSPKSPLPQKKEHPHQNPQRTLHPLRRNPTSPRNPFPAGSEPSRRPEPLLHFFFLTHHTNPSHSQSLIRISPQPK